MSKRCELQKEYYKEYGNYKGSGKYSDHYVKWLESEVLALRLYGVVKCPKCNNRNVDPKDGEVRNRCRDCQIFF